MKNFGSLAVFNTI